jgi:hypothetical protein
MSVPVRVWFVVDVMYGKGFAATGDRELCLQLELVSPDGIVVEVFQARNHALCAEPRWLQAFIVGRCTLNRHWLL